MSGRRIDLARAVHNALAETTCAYGRVLEEVAQEVALLEGVAARQAKMIADQSKMIDEMYAERRAILEVLPAAAGTTVDRIRALVEAERKTREA